MKITNNAVAALVLVFISISLLHNMFLYFYTEAQEGITAKQTASVSLCVNYGPVLDNVSTQNATQKVRFILYINATDLNGDDVNLSFNSTVINFTIKNRTNFIHVHAHQSFLSVDPPPKIIPPGFLQHVDAHTLFINITLVRIMHRNRCFKISSNPR